MHIHKGTRPAIHESGIAASLLDLAGTIARQNNLAKINRVVVVIGDFAGVEAEALAFAFQVLSRSTLAEGAELYIERAPILLRCRACECEYPAEIHDLACPACEGQDFDILQGRELLLKSVSGERDED